MIKNHSILFLLLIYSSSFGNTIGPFFHPREDNFDVSIIIDKDNNNQSFTIASDGKETDFTFEAPLTKRTIIKKALNVPLDSTGTYTITQNNSILIQKTIPAKPNKQDPFTFLVYGDLREPTSQPLVPNEYYTTQHSVARATIQYLKNYLDTNQNMQPALHLLSGDITRVGGDGNQLLSVLSSGQFLLTNQVIMSSIGNHELYNYYTKNKNKKLYQVPHFGNLFYYDQPQIEPKWFKSANKLTQRYFDVGCVRFIHLPYIDFQTVSGHPELVNDFITTVQQAHKAKACNEIMFIIVYSHAPLITHPQHKTEHYGIFEGHNYKNPEKATIIGELKKLEACFATYAVDALFCGHNHLYSRLTWGDETFAMPQITMGLGTHLHETKTLIDKPLNKKHHGYTVTGYTFYDKNSFVDGNTKRNILGFLSCQVDPTTESISVTLHGSPHYRSKKNFNYQNLDSFTITARPASMDAQMPPVCHAPFEGMGPFFHAKSPLGLSDVSIIVSTENSSGNFLCNNTNHAFKTALGNTHQLIKFTNIDLSDGYYHINQDKKILCLGYLPYPKPNDNFSFYVYGDTRGTSTDANKIYQQTIDYISQYEKQLDKKTIMHLNTGDLVKHGGKSKQWLDFFATSNNSYRGRILTAALGNHELYVKSNEYYTKMTPHFANIFFLEQALGPSLPKEYLNQTVTSSDVGPIRFIHLPYLEPSFITGMNPDPIDIFIEKLKESQELIKDNDSPIKYIIWYIHRPFVGTQTKYKPLLSDSREGYPELAQKLYDALDECPPSGIFFGHKHYYFRADYVNKNNVTIPMITIGFGTTINPAGKLKRYKVNEHLVKPRKVIAQKEYPNNLVGFINCTVTPQSITGSLIGAPYESQSTPSTYDTLDSFTMYPTTILS